MIYELQSGADQTLALAEPGLNTGVVSCEVDSARLFQGVPTVARQIEESAACEQLSRIRNRLALAEFYRAYRPTRPVPGCTAGAIRARYRWNQVQAQTIPTFVSQSPLVPPDSPDSSCSHLDTLRSSTAWSVGLPAVPTGEYGARWR